ncbi:MAG: hypothetical protein JNM90_03490, partial [Burkholderiales bacterium]|nr:hypothetical protein [Burkholderiales bacterium]
GNDGIIAWGRWLGGTDSAGRNLAPFPDGNGPFHYVVGLPVTNMPQSGEATYSAIGATASCGSSGCQSVAVTGATLSVNFGTLSGTHSTSMLINGVPSNFTGSLGVSSGAIDLRRFDASGYGYGSANGYSFEGYINGRGVLAGDGASRAGMAFRVTGSVYGPGYGYFSSSSITANGAIAYKKQ